MEPQAAEQPTPDLSFMEQLFEGKLPTQEQFVHSLASTDAVQGILLVAFGLVYLVYGWKAFKVLVILNAAVLGTIAGYNFGKLLEGDMPGFAAFAGAVLFAVLAWPLMRYAVSLMGCLTGALVGYSVWNYVATAAGQEELTQYAWAGSIIGLMALGLIAFLMLQVTVMVFTSLQGAVMTVAGVLAILMKYDQIAGDLRENLASNQHLLPLMIFVPALIGLGFQYSAVAKKAKKKKKASESG